MMSRLGACSRRSFPGTSRLQPGASLEFVPSSPLSPPPAPPLPQDAAAAAAAAGGPPFHGLMCTEEAFILNPTVIIDNNLNTYCV